MKKIFVLLTLILSLYNELQAQPFLLQSTGEAKSFSLRIHYGSQGKGAFVQYVGQPGRIQLKIRSFERDTSGREERQPDFSTYVWDEIIDGKVTGSYGLTEGLRHIEDAWYVRGKDRKKFKLKSIEEKTKYDGVAKYLLNGTLIEFNRFYNDKLSFRYPNKTLTKLELPEILQPQGARQSHIGDYNFDGYDDVAFSVADAGMGVYQQYTIYLYNPKNSQFYLLEEPNYPAKANCSCLCDVRLDAVKKEFITSCRGGAKWWHEVWKFKNGKLVWLRSEEKDLKD